MKMTTQLFYLSLFCIVMGVAFKAPNCFIMACVCSVGSMVIKGVKEVLSEPVITVVPRITVKNHTHGMVGDKTGGAE